MGDGEDADEAGPQVGALAPQVLRLLLHVHRVPDVDVDLVLKNWQDEELKDALVFISVISVISGETAQ